MPATTKVITHCSAPIENASSSPIDGTQPTTCVVTWFARIDGVYTAAQTTVASGTSASTQKARRPSARTTTGAIAPTTKWAMTIASTQQTLR